jgi:hypothetical protein
VSDPINLDSIARNSGTRLTLIAGIMSVDVVAWNRWIAFFLQALIDQASQSSEKAQEPASRRSGVKPRLHPHIQCV